jgi:hypothetical protein
MLDIINGIKFAPSLIATDITGPFDQGRSLSIWLVVGSIDLTGLKKRRP